MRKHFLILFLMAILPLAGWAQVDIKTFEFEIEESSYAYSAQAPVIEPYLHLPNVVTPLALGTDYELKYYNANGSEWTGANPPVNVGTYMVGAHGIGSYTGYTDIKVTYYITPKNINDVHVVNALIDRKATICADCLKELSEVMHLFTEELLGLKNEKGSNNDAREESFGKVPVQEQANRSRIVVMRGRIRQVRNRKGIHQLRANVDLMMTGRIREYNMGSLGE